MSTGECRSCGAAILWWQTPTGKRMPVDDVKAVLPAGPLLEDGEVWGQPDEVKRLLGHCHFVSCPNANAHRKPRPSGGR